jgi:branched-chain amino acid transport system substrate-binding protein
MPGGSDRSPTAAATLSLSGTLALQGTQAARGIELWADEDQVRLHLVDDASRPEVAGRAYREWLLAGELDLLLGPYGSNMVRGVAPLASQRGVLLWNHGGSSDDLARPWVVPVAAPASTYFLEAIELAHRQGLDSVVLIRGPGRFAREVMTGAANRAAELGLLVAETTFSEWRSFRSWTSSAVLVAGAFQNDLELVREVRQSTVPGMLGCVAAGLPEFGERLGPVAEGVVGPVQWIPGDTAPQVGPSGIDFVRRYQAEYGAEPGYVAAQAAAAGYLAAESLRRGHQDREVMAWRTTTLLGSFAIDEAWRQVGHTVSLIRWQGGRQKALT